MPDTAEEDQEIGPQDDGTAAVPTTASFLRGERLPQRPEYARQIGYVVLPWNAETVRVFRQCQPTILAGFGAAAYLGISARELRSALALERVPLARRELVIAGVRLMDRVTSEVEKEKAKENGGSTAR